jgi:O-antigen ligase
MSDFFLIIIFLIILLTLIALSYIIIQHFEFSVLLILLSPFFSSYFVPNTSPLEYELDTTLGSYIRIGTVIFLAIIGVIKLVQNRDFKILTTPKYLVLLIIYILFAILSYFYSIDKNITLIRSLDFLMLFIYLVSLHFWLNSEIRFEKVFQMFIAFIFVFIFLNIVVILFQPSKAWWYSSPDRLEGITSQPNSLGTVLKNFPPLLLLYSIWESKSTKKYLYYIYIILVLGLILLTGSRTSLITSFFLIILWFIFEKKWEKLFIIIVILTLLLSIFSSFEPENLKRGHDRSFTDLTDRENFWTGAIILIFEKPWTGYGYSVEGAIWQDPRFYDPKLSLWMGSAKTSLHNGYLSSAIGLGIPGFVFWLFLLLYPFFYLKISTSPSILIPFWIIQIGYLITNFTETAIYANPEYWLTWLMVLSYTKFQMRGQQNHYFRDLRLT